MAFDPQHVPLLDLAYLVNLRPKLVKEILHTLNVQPASDSAFYDRGRISEYGDGELEFQIWEHYRQTYSVTPAADWAGGFGHIMLSADVTYDALIDITRQFNLKPRAWTVLEWGKPPHRKRKGIYDGEQLSAVKQYVEQRRKDTQPWWPHTCFSFSELMRMFSVLRTQQLIRAIKRLRLPSVEKANKYGERGSQHYTLDMALKLKEYFALAAGVNAADSLGQLPLWSDAD
jgi:hypothetical protein